MKKRDLASSLILIVLTASSLISVGTLHFSQAQTGTNVSYIVGSDTTWTQSNSPYNFTGNVLVNVGVTLTIGSDATVNLNNYYLRVNGTLIIQPGATINIGLIGDGIQVNGVLSAIGTSANPVYINGNALWHNFPTPFASTSTITFSSSSTGWSQQTNSGSIVENAIVNFTGFEVANAVKISSCDFLSGDLTLLGGSPTVSDNNIACGFSLIDGMNVQLATSGLSPAVSNNRVTDGLYIEAGSGTVTDNVISGGLTVDDAYESPVSTLVERNLIGNSSVGISVGISSSYNNQAVIENNTVTSNSVGIQIGKYAPTISNNNIYGNSLNVKLTGQSSAQINLPNNWWGTTDQQAISQTIYDYKNDFNLGTVSFVPFLTAPNPEATPNPNLPLPTPAANPTPTPFYTLTNSTMHPVTQPPTQQTAKPSQPTNNSTPVTSQNSQGTPTFSLSVTGLLVVIAVLLAVIAVLIVGMVVLLRRTRKPSSNATT